MDAQTIEIILDRIQKIEASQFRTEAILRNIYRELNYIPDVPQAPNLSVIKTTH
jgi:hypothetical protein